MNQSVGNKADLWPALPLDSWQDTYSTLHMWAQIVGKIRLGLSPRVNHWWNVPLYVNARGLTTSMIPYRDAKFELAFDFIDHKLRLHTSTGVTKSIPLSPRSVAEFYREVREMLLEADISVKIWSMPVEIPNPIPFDQDFEHKSYDPEAANKFWRILLSVQCVFDEFRSKFIGKSSPVHFFWGSFDLAVTRFSGRGAPERPGADSITREAYSHEVSSVGFWPGGGEISGPAFYSYAAPEPAGFREAHIEPSSASYNTGFGEYLLMYDDVRNSPSPESTILRFCESTYQAAADLGNWDREALERR